LAPVLQFSRKLLGLFSQGGEAWHEDGHLLKAFFQLKSSVNASIILEI